MSIAIREEMLICRMISANNYFIFAMNDSHTKGLNEICACLNVLRLFNVQTERVRE